MNEYQRLMAHYGVTTASPIYGGQAAPAPNATNFADLQARYLSDRGAYNQYLTDYNSRVGSNQYGPAATTQLNAPVYGQYAAQVLPNSVGGGSTTTNPGYGVDQSNQINFPGGDSPSTASPGTGGAAGSIGGGPGSAANGVTSDGVSIGMGVIGSVLGVPGLGVMSQSLGISQAIANSMNGTIGVANQASVAAAMGMTAAEAASPEGQAAVAAAIDSAPVSGETQGNNAAISSTAAANGVSGATGAAVSAAGAAAAAAVSAAGGSAAAAGAAGQAASNAAMGGADAATAAAAGAAAGASASNAAASDAADAAAAAADGNGPSAAAASDAAAAAASAADSGPSAADGGTSAADGGPSGGDGGGASGGDGGYAKGGLFNKYGVRSFAEGGLVNEYGDKYSLEQPAPDMATQQVQAMPQQQVQAMPQQQDPSSTRNLMTMYAQYAPSSGVDYGKELETSRATASREVDTFNKMIESAMNQKSEGPSKAEMYFRLAAAFGAPTKHGNFFESLGKAGEAMAEHSKEVRATSLADLARKQQLGMTMQQSKMLAAKQDVDTVRHLASDEMKDRRALGIKILEQSIASGKPQSEAGKVAADSGLKQGTPEFSAFVTKHVKDKLESGDYFKGIMAAIAQGNLAANQDRVKIATSTEQRQVDAGAKLTSGEMKLKTLTEDMLGSTDQAMANLNQAFKLNPNTFDNSLPDLAQRKLLEYGGSKDPKLLATREQINLLEKAALSQLKSTFPGAISNDERKVLMSVQGLDAKSIEERGIVINNAYQALKSIKSRSTKRLDDIKKGLYRETSSEPAPAADGGLE